MVRSRRKSDDDAPASTSRWWSVKGERATADALWGWLERLRNRQRKSAAMDAVWDAIYADEPIGLSEQASAAGAIARAREARLNLAQSMVDTCGARITKRRPMPAISADDAGFSEKLYAKRASRVLRRKMGQSKVERLCPAVAFSGMVRGTGVAHVYPEGGDVALEAVPRREVFVDPSEARYGTPRVMARLMRVGKDELAAQYPDHADAIRMATSATREEWEPYVEQSELDQLEVVEGWRLPSFPGADDGRHVIAIRGEVLLDEPWTCPRFPLVFFHWSPPLVGCGFFGNGLVKAVASTQSEINSIIGGMAEGINLAQALKVFVQRGSNIDKHHLRARNPAVIEHDGAVPAFVAPTPFSMAVLEYCKWRIQQAYEIAGVSQASAASKNPLGSNASGKALDTMYDLESDRFAHVEMQYATFRVDLGMAILDCARAIAAEEEPVAKPAAWIDGIDWDRLDVDSGTYQLILEPENFLPQSRAGRLATVSEAAAAGLLGTDPSVTASLFDEPDIQRANRYILGLHRRIERWLEDLADEGTPLADCMPTPYMLRVPNKARDMLLGEMDNIQAEADPDDAEAEIVLGRYRWAADMLKSVEEQMAADISAATPPMQPAPGSTPAGLMPDPMAATPAMPMDPNMMMPPLDPMGGLTAQLAAGMPPPQGAM